VHSCVSSTSPSIGKAHRLLLTVRTRERRDFSFVWL
jgi:hypothetical protein